MTVKKAPAVFDRFLSERGDTLVLDALKGQKIILGNAEAAEEIRARGALVCFSEGETVIAEGEWNNDIVFILAGRAKVLVSGFKVAERNAGLHVGEMALIDPAQPRAASVVAMEPTVGLVVSEENFSAVASHHPDLWRQISKDIASRLRERKKFIRPSNAVPYMFIACASESLNVATAIKSHFSDESLIAEIWTDGVFKPSRGTMESLEAKLTAVDFAVAIFSADDSVKSRGDKKFAPRDNTVFELGLFAGAIGRERSFFAVPRGGQVKIPSDLAGITSLRFSVSGKGVADVAEACAFIKERISALGPR